MIADSSSHQAHVEFYQFENAQNENSIQKSLIELRQQ